MDTANRISLANIAEAAETIAPEFRHSPQVRFDSLCERLNAKITIKIETINPIRSFKGRGGDYFVHSLPEKTPLVCASAGNFGQGLAYAARRHGLEVTVFAAENANRLKVERMGAIGAKVVLTGNDLDDAKASAQAAAADAGHLFVEDGREPAISEGAGTIAVELTRGDVALDAAVIPVGNGALINGMATWLKAHSPSTQIIGVCAAGAPAMERSWRAGLPIQTSHADTIADGIGVRIPVPDALNDMAPLIDDMVLVDDGMILNAMRALLADTGVLAEPAGAAGLAAIMADPDRFRDLRLATVICGSNVTGEQFTEWFQN